MGVIEDTGRCDLPNGGSDCCATCWHNRPNGGKAGRPPGDRPAGRSYCEIRQLDIPSPFYTYCANHPNHRPGRDPIPIGPVFKNRFAGASGVRDYWQPSPDTEDIRQHLLKIIRTPREHFDEGYHWYAPPAFVIAVKQLVEWADDRVVGALTELIERDDMQQARESLEGLLQAARESLGPG